LKKMCNDNGYQERKELERKREGKKERREKSK
jgi:hypothetical protein